MIVNYSVSVTNGTATIHSVFVVPAGTNLNTYRFGSRQNSGGRLTLSGTYGGLGSAAETYGVSLQLVVPIR